MGFLTGWWKRRYFIVRNEGYGYIRYKNYSMMIKFEGFDDRTAEDITIKKFAYVKGEGFWQDDDTFSKKDIIGKRPTKKWKRVVLDKIFKSKS